MPRLRLLAHAALLACSLPVMAQEAVPVEGKLDRVEITGSSIKRPVSEGAVSVQIITKEDMQKAGITTAAEMVATLSSASNSLTDGSSITTGGWKDQTGFNSVNLRGLGTSSTLVLLNGRRMANFASPGDDAGVDLNNIPAAAIERVEVLLDGASAIYGTDAIGGVVNFITRKDYQGLQLDAYGGKTSEDGAGKRSFSIAGGVGDLARDGFNLMAVIDTQRTGRLDTAQRKFISELEIPKRLPWLLSGVTYPANVRITSDQRDYLNDHGFTIGGQPIVNRTINLTVPNCAPPASLYLPNGIGGVNACTYDFMRDLELYPKTEKSNAFGRGVFRLGSDHELFIEASYSKAKSWYVGTSNRINADYDIANIPALAATGIADALPDDRIVTVQTRMIEAGKRTSELTSTGSRILVGMNGTVSAWDYNWAYNHSVNSVRDHDGQGYLLYDKIYDGILAGSINPFGPSSAAGLAIIKNSGVNEDVRGARGSMDSFDIKATRTLAKLAGGDMGLALGAEVRREAARSWASDLLISDNIMGDATPGDAQFTNNSRRVWAVFGEVVAPITKQLELQFAVRHDQYQRVGGTTNPKLGLLYSVTPTFVLHASAGTGFRAPSMNDLYRPTKTSTTALLPDPVCMAENGNDLSFCADYWPTRVYSNANLKPERSRQFALGGQWQATPEWSGGLDYWNIAKRDIISTIGDDVILGNLAKYGNLVHRYNQDGNPLCDYDPDDSAICYIDLKKENRGRQKSSGLDITLQFKSRPTDWGRFGAKLVGTLTLRSQEQTGNEDPYVSNLGKFVTDGVVQRWRHRLTLDWEKGAFSVALSNTYLAGYNDQNSAIDTDTGLYVDPNKVKAYSLWDMSAAWEATKALTLRVGVKNMFNTSPPFSNQAYYFISGYDPSYTDPRGRFMFLSGSYKF